MQPRMTNPNRGLRFSLLVAIAAPLGTIACSGSPADDTTASASAIVGGGAAPVGAWPSIAGIYHGQTVVCGGTLVADEWVLTAAHCLQPYLDHFGVTSIAVGRHDASNEAEGETFTLKNGVRHPSFDYFNTSNDIALIQLSRASRAPHARLAKSSDVARMVAGATTTVTGWGETVDDGEGSDRLLQVSLPLVGNAECHALPSYANVTPDMLCALDPGRGTCHGDSGGPLWMTLDGAPAQIGIVSWSVGCAQANQPSVYTNVGRYREWIAQASGGAIAFE